MRQRLLLFLAITLLAFGQATIFSFNLVLLLVLSLGVVRSAKSGLVWAFIAGVVLDLVTGQTLGLSSLIFLLIIFLLNLYKTKFKAANFAYLLPFTLLSVWFYEFFQGEPLALFEVATTTAFLFLVWPAVNFWVRFEESQNPQLPLKL